MEVLKDEYRCITMDLRNANGGESSGPLEVDRPWDSYTDDQLGLMDHLGIDKFMVLGFCIGGPFIWNMLQARARARRCRRAGAAERLSPGGARPVLPEQHEGLGAGAVREAARRHDGDVRRIPHQDVSRTHPDFVFSVTRDFVRSCTRRRSWSCRTTPRPHPYAVAEETAMLAPNAQMTFFPWKEDQGTGAARHSPLADVPEGQHAGLTCAPSASRSTGRGK